MTFSAASIPESLAVTRNVPIPFRTRNRATRRKMFTNPMSDPPFDPGALVHLAETRQNESGKERLPCNESSCFRLSDTVMDAAGVLAGGRRWGDETVPGQRPSADSIPLPQFLSMDKPEDRFPLSRCWLTAFINGYSIRQLRLRMEKPLKTKTLVYLSEVRLPVSEMAREMSGLRLMEQSGGGGPVQSPATFRRFRLQLFSGLIRGNQR